MCASAWRATPTRWWSPMTCWPGSTPRPAPPRCALLALTGWGEREPDPVAYLNADAGGVMHTPGFAPELAGFLTDDRPGVRAVGLDTASLDFGPSTDFSFHVAWLPTGRYGIENLSRLDELPPKGATLVVGAPKLWLGAAALRGSWGWFEAFVRRQASGRGLGPFLTPDN